MRHLISFYVFLMLALSGEPFDTSTEMGKVFSYDQITRFPSAVPTPQEFVAVKSDFEDQVMTELERGTLTGAIIFGSVSIGGAGPRSDFDCMIIPPDYSHESVASMKRVILAAGTGKKVDINAIPHSRERLASGAHEIDACFGGHLVGPSRIVLGEDPAEYMKFRDESAYVIFAEYLRNKKRKAAAALLAHGGDRYELYQRVLEVPLAIGRKALWLIDELENTNHPTSGRADKDGVLQASLSLFDDLKLGETPRSIVEVDAMYSEALRRANEGEMSSGEYENVLLHVANVAVETNTWLDEFDARIAGIVRTT